MIICVLLAQVYCIFLWLFLLVFCFCFLSTRQEIGWQEHLRNDLFLCRVSCETLTRSFIIIPVPPVWISPSELHFSG